MKKIRNIIFLVTGMLFLLGSFGLRAEASVGDSLSGWAWGGSTSAIVAGIPTSLGWISLNDVGTASAFQYGVNVPATDGVVTSAEATGPYAWSSNLGWISFRSADVTGCPFVDGTCEAHRVGNELRGWARIIGVVGAGGYNGWISLHALPADPIQYGVALPAVTGSLPAGSYAWSSDFGYIDFSGVSMGVPPLTYQLKICASCTAASSRLGPLTLTQGSSYNAKACKVATTEPTCAILLPADDVTASASWSSDNNPVASVTAAGVITGNTANSSATVTAVDAADGISDSVVVSVTSPPPVCGNGITEAPAEACDDGAANGSCSSSASCSDGSGSTPKCQANSCVSTDSWKEVAP